MQYIYYLRSYTTYIGGGGDWSGRGWSGEDGGCCSCSSGGSGGDRGSGGSGCSSCSSDGGSCINNLTIWNVCEYFKDTIDIIWSIPYKLYI